MISSLPLVPPQKRLQLHRERDISEIDPSLRECIGQLVRGERQWPLLIFGPVGCGKSFAALCLCDCVDSAFYGSVSDVCDLVIKQDDFTFDVISRKRLAVLDELGTASSPSDFHKESICRFADARERQPSIYISNIEPRALWKLYGDRVFSRIGSGTRFAITGPDRRMMQ